MKRGFQGADVVFDVGEDIGAFLVPVDEADQGAADGDVADGRDFGDVLGRSDCEADADGQVASERAGVKRQPSRPGNSASRLISTGTRTRRMLRPFARLTLRQSGLAPIRAEAGHSRQRVIRGRITRDSAQGLR